jgi:hypothetical protein
VTTHIKDAQIDVGDSFPQRRQETSPDPGPLVPKVRIGWILPRLEADLLQMSGQFFPPERQERPNQPPPASCHSRQTGGTRPAEDTHEDGFDLVVLMVSGDHQVRPELASQAMEPGVPSGPGGGFAGSGTQLEALDVDWLAIALGHSPHCGCHGGTLGVDAVIGVGHVQREICSAGGVNQKIEEDEGVGSARNGHDGRTGGKRECGQMQVKPLLETHGPSNGSMCTRTS